MALTRVARRRAWRTVSPAVCLAVMAGPSKLTIVRGRTQVAGAHESRLQITFLCLAHGLAWVIWRGHRPSQSITSVWRRLLITELPTTTAGLRHAVVRYYCASRLVDAVTMIPRGTMRPERPVTLLGPERNRTTSHTRRTGYPESSNPALRTSTSTAPR